MRIGIDDAACQCAKFFGQCNRIKHFGHLRIYDCAELFGNLGKYIVQGFEIARLLEARADQ